MTHQERAEKIVNELDNCPMRKDYRATMIAAEIASAVEEATKKVDAHYAMRVIEVNKDCANHAMRLAYEDAAKIAELMVTNHSDISFQSGFEHALEQLKGIFRARAKELK